MYLNVFICEDHPKHRAHLDKIVKEHIAHSDLDVVLSLTTDDPSNVLEYLEENPGNTGLYILDVDLRHMMSGIDLAAKIKEYDVNPKIVFVTTHSELAHLTFSHKVNAMDYIIKDNPKNVKKRVVESIEEAYAQFLSDKVSKRKFFSVKSGGEHWNIPVDEILYFETHQSVRHRIILHTRNSQIEYRCLISEVSEKEPEFVRVNKSYVVNTMNVLCVDKTNMEVVMKNGAKVPLTASRVKALIESTQTT